MRIFWYEFKKILNWKLLLILLLFSGLYYWMFLSFDLMSCYPNGHPATENLEIGKVMLKRYGLTMDAAEFKNFKTAVYPEIKKEATEKIARIKAFQDAKITTIDQFAALDEKKDDASKELVEKLFTALDETIPLHPTTPDPYYMYQEGRDEVKDLENWYAAKPDTEALKREYPGGAAWERAALLENRAQAEGTPTIPDSPVVSIWRELDASFSVLLLFTVAVLISPFLVRERRNGVRSLAYTCRKGRGIFGTQLAASAAAAVLALLVQFAVFSALFRFGPHRDDLLFLNCDVSSSLQIWFDMTFGQYIAVTCGMMFLLAFGFAFLSFTVSKFCKSYVAVLAVQIPVSFLMSKLSGWLLSAPLYIGNPQYLGLCVCAACFFVPLAACLLLKRREKTADVLS